MKLKTILPFVLFAFLCGHPAAAQVPTNHLAAATVSVITDTNGNLVSPTNLFSQNAAKINAVVTNGGGGSSTNPYQAGSLNLSNFSQLNTNAFLNAQIASNAFQAASPNLTNWAKVATNNVLFAGVSNLFTGAFAGNAAGATNLNTAGYLSVTDPRFGAKGDDNTDNTAAIQSAANYAGSISASSGNSTNLIGGLYFPAGIFQINSPIQVVPYQPQYESETLWYASTHLFGDGPVFSVLRQQNPTNSGLYITNANAQQIQFGGFSVLGGYNGTNNSGSLGLGITNTAGTGNNNGEIRNVNVVGFQTGYELYEEDITLLNNNAQNCLLGYWFPNTGNGNNNVNLFNCTFTHDSATPNYHQLASTNTQIGLRIDSGQGHTITSGSWNMVHNAIAMQFRGAGVTLLGNHFEDDNGSTCVDLSGSYGFGGNYVTLIDNSLGAQGGADSTNRYAVIVGTNAYVTLVGNNSYPGYTAKSPFKVLNTTNNYIQYLGQFPLTYDLWSANGSNYLGTFPLSAHFPVLITSNLTAQNITVTNNLSVSNQLSAGSFTLATNGAFTGQISETNLLETVVTYTLSTNFIPSGATYIGGSGDFAGLSVYQIPETLFPTNLYLIQFSPGQPNAQYLTDVPTEEFDVEGPPPTTNQYFMTTGYTGPFLIYDGAANDYNGQTVQAKLYQVTITTNTTFGNVTSRTTFYTTQPTGPTLAQIGANNTAMWASNGYLYASTTVGGTLSVKQIAP